MVLFCTQFTPTRVYMSVVKSEVKYRSLLRRREAIRMKMRNAVSEKPKPFGFFSANIATSISTRAMLSPERIDERRGGFQVEQTAELVVTRDSEFARAQDIRGRKIHQPVVVGPL